jgi:hypothetical protein
MCTRLQKSWNILYKEAILKNEIHPNQRKSSYDEFFVYNLQYYESFLAPSPFFGTG